MGLAQTDDSVTCGWTADVEFLQLPALCLSPNPNPVYSLFETDGGTAYLFWTQDAQEEANENFLNVTITADEEEETDQESAGGYVVVGEEGETEWSGPTEYSGSPSYSLGPMWPYKVRDDDATPAELDAPCHPNHPVMKYAWGSRDYDITLATGMGTTIAEEALELVPVWAAAGGGTTELPGGTLAITVGHDASGFAMDPVSGLVCHITNIKMAGVAVNLRSVRQPSVGSVNGFHAEFGSDWIKLYCDDYTAGGTSASAFAVLIYPPVICDYRVRLWSWGAALVGDFSIHDEDPDATGRRVMASGTSERVVYGREAYACFADGFPVESLNHGRRIWDVNVTVDPTWAEANNEVVDPDDSLCTIEESDLGMDPDAVWEGFEAARAQELSLQLPSDAGGVLPSTWEPQTGGLTVRQVGKTTEVTVGAAVTSGSILRTLVTDYIGFRTTEKATLGVPGCYRLRRHKPGSDIWNIENFRYLAFDYTSEKAATFYLTITYLDITDNDTHTEPNREDDYTYDTSQQTVVHEFDVIEGSGRVYVDLGESEDPELPYLFSYEISGFEGTFLGEWQFDIEDMVLVQYNPVTTLEVGYDDAKITFPRYGVSYTGLTQTAEGIRICRPGDQINTKCGEAGLDFTERVTNPGGVADHMRRLEKWYRELARQEGFTVTSVADALSQDMTGYNCRKGHATYDAAFVDAFDNDMLDDTLYTGDCLEKLDIASISPIAVHPRVGHILPLSGFPLPVYVDHIIDGSIHGRTLTPGQTIYLSEVDGASRVATDITNAWGRFEFLNSTGVRENKLAYVEFEDGTGSATTFQVYNEIRPWAFPVQGGLYRPSLEVDRQFAKVFLVYEKTSGAIYLRQWWPAHGWRDAELVPDAGTWPMVARRHICSVNDLLFVRGTTVRAQEQRAWLNEWSNKSAVIAAEYFAADSFPHGIGLLYYSEGTYYHGTIRRPTRALRNASVEVGEGTAGAPSLCYNAPFWTWYAAIPTAEGIDLYKGTPQGSSWAWSKLRSIADAEYPVVSTGAPDNVFLTTVEADGDNYKAVFRRLGLDGSDKQDAEDIGRVSRDRLAFGMVWPIEKLMVVGSRFESWGAGQEDLGLVVYTSKDWGRTWTLETTLTP